MNKEQDQEQDQEQDKDDDKDEKNKHDKDYYGGGRDWYGRDVAAPFSFSKCAKDDENDEYGCNGDVGGRKRRRKAMAKAKRRAAVAWDGRKSKDGCYDDDDDDEQEDSCEDVDCFDWDGENVRERGPCGDGNGTRPQTKRQRCWMEHDDVGEGCRDAGTSRAAPHGWAAVIGKACRPIRDDGLAAEIDSGKHLVDLLDHQDAGAGAGAGADANQAGDSYDDDIFGCGGGDRGDGLDDAAADDDIDDGDVDDGDVDDDDDDDGCFFVHPPESASASASDCAMTTKLEKKDDKRGKVVVPKRQVAALDTSQRRFCRRHRPRLLVDRYDVRSLLDPSELERYVEEVEKERATRSSKAVRKASVCALSSRTQDRIENDEKKVNLAEEDVDMVDMVDMDMDVDVDVDEATRRELYLERYGSLPEEYRCNASSASASAATHVFLSKDNKDTNENETVQASIAPSECGMNKYTNMNKEGKKKDAWIGTKSDSNVNADSEAGACATFQLTEAESNALPPGMLAPSDRRTNDVMRLTASRSHAAPQFELVLKVRRSCDPQFAFLQPGHSLHPYYLFLRKNGGKIPLPPSPSPPSIVVEEKEKKKGKEGTTLLGGLLGMYTSSEDEGCLSDDKDDDDDDDDVDAAEEEGDNGGKSAGTTNASGEGGEEEERKVHKKKEEGIAASVGDDDDDGDEGVRAGAGAGATGTASEEMGTVETWPPSSVAGNAAAAEEEDDIDDIRARRLKRAKRLRERLALKMGGGGGTAAPRGF